MSKYAASSSLSVVIDFTLLFILVEQFSVHYVPAAIFAFVFGHSLNYIITRKWNFHNTDRKHKLAYSLFVGFGLLSLLITVFLLRFLVENLGMYYITARVVAGLIVGLCNFLWNYYITFKAHLIPEDVDKF